MNEIDSFPINSKINLDSLDLNSYSDRYSEFDSNTNSEINIFSNNDISFDSYE